MRKEYGNKMMLTSLLYQFALAWVAGVIVNIVGSAFMAANSPIEIAITAVIVIITAVILIRNFTRPGSSCTSCSGGGENGGCANCSACGNLKACSMKNENLLDQMNKRK